MKVLTVLIMTLALSLAACGGKDKKKTTVPDTTDTSGGGQTGQAPVETNTDDAAKRAAELQQTVYFEFDSSDLDDASRAKLTENADWLKEDPTRELTIEGHTDEVGTTEYNAALGERRAQAARDYLVRLGIDAKRVRIITYGEERPASEQDELNRRSVFIATKK